jgi:hypothetical protein
MGSHEWQREMQDAVRHEAWSLSGATRVVKVVPCDVARPLAEMTTVRLTGYVCQEIVLLGQRPEDIEGRLGLRVGSCAKGCRIFRFERLPNPSEVAYELTAEFPDGLAFGPLSNRLYPPGSRAVHQWRLLAEVPARPLLDLAPGTRYPYMHARS